ncbi:hypothetical protein EG68_09993 [Paragonimus skrjabini miyazakii]|uniref:Protein SPT2 homolog n=1 Tax=Paragonimus skrjabini miyazakii TaxID=59628 RepID=A0A8S9YIV4_9TREM|nr:hypothetical protein EG68_09993 [Paragonimus skrjabini miyazakii]
MEFRAFLALAQKKQLKKDEEVRQLEEINLVRKKKLLKECQESRVAQRSSNHLVKKENVSDSPKEKVGAVNISEVNNSSRLHRATESAKDPPSDHSTNHQFNKSNKQVNGLPKEKKEIPRDVVPPTVVSKPKPCKPSFSDMLELAKKNVANQPVKRKAFDDLIPCAPDPKYSKLEVTDTTIKTKTPSASDFAVSKVTKNINPSVSRTKQTTVQISDKVKKQVGNSTVSVRALTHSVSSLPKASKVRNGDIACVPAKGIKRISIEGAPRISTESTPKSAIALQRGLDKSLSRPPEGTHVLLKTPRDSTPSKSQLNSRIPKVDKLSQRTVKTVSATEPHMPSSKKVAEKPSTKASLGSKPKTSDNNSCKDKHPFEKFTKAVGVSNHLYRPPTGARGIAAQLGVLPVRTVDEPIDTYSESEDYESDDSFIDDSEAIESQEYARVVRDVHRALRFDPRKYKEVNPWDDLRSMEANFRDIEKEEKRSARLGALEDALEIEKDAKRKKEKLMRQNPQP